MVLAAEATFEEKLHALPDLVVLQTEEQILDIPNVSFLGKVAGFFEPKFDPQFDRELKDPRSYISTEGLNIPMTYRIFNQEYFNNGNPMVVYNFSLFVPGHRGAELPSLFEITRLAREHGSAVIAITTDGYDQELTKEQLYSLKNFEGMAQRRLDLLEDITTQGQELIVTGASLGGMMSYEIAALNSRKSNSKVSITKIISLCSSGHNSYAPYDLVKVFRQFSTGELMPAFKYLRCDDNPVNIFKRTLEFAQTVPTNTQQVIASSLIAYAILNSPLKKVEQMISPETEVLDEVYSSDSVSQPYLRPLNWDKAKDHPKSKHQISIVKGNHLSLLTHGLETTLLNLF